MEIPVQDRVLGRPRVRGLGCTSERHSGECDERHDGCKQTAASHAFKGALSKHGDLPYVARIAADGERWMRVRPSRSDEQRLWHT